MAPEIEGLEKILGRDLSAWKTPRRARETAPAASAHDAAGSPSPAPERPH
jgi:hypothetical protein